MNSNEFEFYAVDDYNLLLKDRMSLLQTIVIVFVVFFKKNMGFNLLGILTAFVKCKTRI